MSNKEISKSELIITDVIESYFNDEDGNEKVKRTFMNGNKVVGEEVKNA